MILTCIDTPSLQLTCVLAGVLLVACWRVKRQNTPAVVPDHVMFETGRTSMPLTQSADSSSETNILEDEESSGAVFVSKDGNHVRGPSHCHYNRSRKGDRKRRRRDLNHRLSHRDGPN